MIRRLKADVMKDLPPKRRTEVRVEIAKKVSDALKKVLMSGCVCVWCVYVR